MLLPTRILSTLLIIFVLAAAGCDGGTGVVAVAGNDGSTDGSITPDGNGGGIAIVVGGSDDEGKTWVPWPEQGASAPMIRGPQGGQHVWVSVRTQGLWPKKMRLDVTMTLVDTGNVVKPGTVPLLLSLDELASTSPPQHQVIGVTAYVKCPCQVKGRKLRVEVDAVDLYGLVGHGEGTVTPTWDGDCSIDPVGSCASQ